jgi:hypothetical protein
MNHEPLPCQKKCGFASCDLLKLSRTARDKSRSPDRTVPVHLASRNGEFEPECTDLRLENLPLELLEFTT